jgi:hypothetical protein
MSEDERIVREVWGSALDADSGGEASIFFHQGDTGFNVPTWAAARAFTEQRLEEIREVRAEIAWLIRQDHSVDAQPVPRRILARLQATLADLQRGMKVQP